MKYFDWSKQDKFDINKLFNTYIAYKNDYGSVEEFLQEVSYLVHFMLLVHFDGIGVFDKDDLIAVSIEKVYDLLNRGIGIFNQDLNILHPVGFSNYIKSIILSASRGFLNSFPLHTIDIPELEYSCSSCENIKIIYSHKAPKRLLCDSCNCEMVLVAVRDGVIPDYLSNSGEYIADVDSYITTMYDLVCEKIMCSNRFNLNESLIRYYVSSKLQSDPILHSCLRNTYGSKNPDIDIDNLDFLYRWAMTDLYDDYRCAKFRRIYDHAF